MRGAGTFEPERLTAELEPFDLTPKPASAAKTGYLKFYHLDFAAEFPGLTHHMGWVDSGEFRIATQLYALPDARGSAIVVHGYYDHVGLFGHLLRFLLEHGLSVLTFDFPGHGLSTGARATIESFDDYVATLVDVRAHLQRLTMQDPVVGPRYLFGQSMGGAVSMEYLCQQGHDDFAEIVLFAPLIRPYAWRINRWVYEIARRTITERKRVITENAENEEFMALMRIDPLAPQVLPVQWVTALVEWMRRFERRERLPFPLRIVQGDADKTVDWRYNLKFLEEHADADILHIGGARHHLVNESEAIRAQMFSWISGFLHS